MLINFDLVNQLIMNIPSPIVTIEDLYIKQGRLKEIIVLDLHSAFYQYGTTSCCRGLGRPKATSTGHIPYTLLTQMKS